MRSIRFSVVMTKHYTNLKLFSKSTCEKISHSLNKIEMKMRIIKGEFNCSNTGGKPLPHQHISIPRPLIFNFKKAL